MTEGVASRPGERYTTNFDAFLVVFETKAFLGCNSMEDADYLRLFQRHLNDAGGMPGRSGPERGDTTGERLPY